MTPFQRISGHVMALFYQFNATRFDLKKPEDATLMDRWKVSLSHCTTDLELIDKCFEPLYSGKRMPQPKDFQQILATKRRIGPERQLPEGSLKNAAKTPFTKALVSLIASGVFIGGGQVGYYESVKKLCVEHGRTDWYDSMDRAIEKGQAQEAKQSVTDKDKIGKLKSSVETINSYAKDLAVSRKKLIEKIAILEQSILTPNPQEA